MLDIYVIGCGGIGGYVCDKLPMALASLSLDMLEKGGIDIMGYLEGAGTLPLPCIADWLVLVDADVFNPRNSLRQGEGAGSKLEKRLSGLLEMASDKGAGRADIAQRMLETMLSRPEGYDDRDLRDVLSVLRSEGLDKLKRVNASMVRKTFLQNLGIIGYNAYVAPSNVEKIIPRTPERNERNSDARCLYGDVPKDFPIVMLCVDNKKTRFEVHKYMESFDDCLIINGGNTKEHGQVLIYEKRDGVALDPPMYEVYPDITADADLRPDEQACTVIAPSHDQVAITNSVCADFMLAMLVKWVKGGLYNESRRGGLVRVNELDIETVQMSVIPLAHMVSAPQK